MGGVNSAREQDFSVGGDAGYVCLGVVHMEEEVQDRVQVEVGREEQGEGETHGESQNEETTRNKRSTAHHGCDSHNQTRAMCMGKMTCKVYMSTPPSQLQWIAINCKRNQL